MVTSPCWIERTFVRFLVEMTDVRLGDREIDDRFYSDHNHRNAEFLSVGDLNIDKNSGACVLSSNYNATYILIEY